MDDVAALLAAWMVRQRWYATKGQTPRIRIIGTVHLATATADARCLIHLVLDEAPEVPVLYQVPVVVRATIDPDASAALIGEAGRDWFYDGPHDPVFAAALLDAISYERHLPGDQVRADGTTLGASGSIVRSRVLGGEQSNTSIVYDIDGGPLPFVIAKVFRVLHHGENPDVTTQAALTQGGSHRAPPLVGYLTATWPDPGRENGTATGHLAFAQEFLPGLDDAWRVALRAAAEAESFADRAYDLGIATAEVHATLAGVLATTPTGAERRRGRPREHAGAAPRRVERSTGGRALRREHHGRVRDGGIGRPAPAPADPWRPPPGSGAALARPRLDAHRLRRRTAAPDG